MVAFGSQKQILIGIGCLRKFVPSLRFCLGSFVIEKPRFVTMVWGDDRLLVKGLKHVAGRLLAMLLYRNLDESAFHFCSRACPLPADVLI